MRHKKAVRPKGKASVYRPLPGAAAMADAERGEVPFFEAMNDPPGWEDEESEDHADDERRTARGT
jgi:hypothetical protein